MTVLPDDSSFSQVETQEIRGAVGLNETQTWPCLTILYHPELRRVGERAILGQLPSGQRVELSRIRPLFAQPGSNDSRPLRDPFLSRQPVDIALHDSKMLRITPPPSVSLHINDAPVEDEHEIPLSALHEGVVLMLSRRVILLLHLVTLGNRYSSWGLVGESHGICQMLRQIAQVADVDVPVLIRGETGVGKERVAQAIHMASNRSTQPCISVNMAAISPGTAASELFGHLKGAFTGAISNKTGFFERADGGTLFLDEVGETPSNIQGMLLRTLAENTIIPVGGSEERKVNVRIIAATDANIEEGGPDGTFRVALLHRLSGYEIKVPPLRERREDIPRLAVHFLEQELAKIGELSRLAPRAMSKKLWFPPKLMLLLYRCNWWGNIRDLGNAIRQLVISSRGMEVIQMDDTLMQRLRAAPPPKTRAKPQSQKPRNSPSTVLLAGDPAVQADFDMLYTVLEANGWNLSQAAKHLGMARSSLYQLIEKDPRLRMAKDIPREEIEHALEAVDHDLNAAARRLRISRRALVRRMSELDIPFPSRP